MSEFAGYHPAVLFIYYVLVLVFAMFTVHPVVLAFVLLGGILLFGALNPLRVLARNLLYYFFFFLLLAVTNPLFAHNGETILFFMNDNPITLEAFVYGAALAIMIVGVMFWCKNYNLIMTSDKFIYLFGKAIPRLSLVLSLALRFIPLFKEQIHKINQTQKVMGLYSTDSRMDRLMSGMRVFNSILSWAIENSLETADAMKARGYGLPGRTNFSLFKFRKRDGVLLGAIAVLTAAIWAGYFLLPLNFTFYPVVDQIQNTRQAAGVYAVVLIYMILPALLEIKEKLRWNYLKSRI
ncbi:energy-coupling factor transporter transmembrane component T [Ruminococcus gauvreauii]|uniref:Energy-coupling factor transporter transmembrane protein EcfT n=1 Tax=Ruminococcus gauvreauii TaxID=438033 RepID=A0ABY5VCA0_9FIRM|nr:energy-coupling factor transporter transmembrane component T [Ruminococcus gauvreauii]UWP58144.1 energy-coupling factor transporter transmembrane protein EcfT [Ruminococcus gauvreauii]